MDDLDDGTLQDRASGLDRPTFASMLESSPSLAIGILEVLSTRRRVADTSITD
jgi:CRP-like cAMP-binding protein